MSDYLAGSDMLGAFTTAVTRPTTSTTTSTAAALAEAERQRLAAIEAERQRQIAAAEAERIMRERAAAEAARVAAERQRQLEAERLRQIAVAEAERVARQLQAEAAAREAAERNRAAQAEAARQQAASAASQRAAQEMAQQQAARQAAVKKPVVLPRSAPPYKAPPHRVVQAPLPSRLPPAATAKAVAKAAKEEKKVAAAQQKKVAKASGEMKALANKVAASARRAIAAGGKRSRGKGKKAKGAGSKLVRLGQKLLKQSESIKGDAIVGELIGVVLGGEVAGFAQTMPSEPGESGTSPASSTGTRGGGGSLPSSGPISSTTATQSSVEPSIEQLKQATAVWLHRSAMVDALNDITELADAIEQEVERVEDVSLFNEGWALIDRCDAFLSEHIYERTDGELGIIGDEEIFAIADQLKADAAAWRSGTGAPAGAALPTDPGAAPSDPYADPYSDPYASDGGYGDTSTYDPRFDSADPNAPVDWGDGAASPASADPFASLPQAQPFSDAGVDWGDESARDEMPEEGGAWEPPPTSGDPSMSAFDEYYDAAYEDEGYAVAYPEYEDEGYAEEEPVDEEYDSFLADLSEAASEDEGAEESDDGGYLDGSDILGAL